MRTLSTESRECLAAQAAADDRDAFNRLAAVYRPLLLEHLRKRVRCDEDAEDLVQETLLKAWLMRRNYRTEPPTAGAKGGSSWFAWCRTIADRLCVDMWRRTRLVETIFVDERSADEQTDALWEIPPTFSPFEETAAEERVVALQAAVERLPTLQKRIVALRVEGYRIAQIAAALRISEATAKTYLHRARKTLKKSVGS